MRRVPGARWRVLAFAWDEKTRMYERDFEAGSIVQPSGDDRVTAIPAPDMEFDELVVDEWLHVEAISVNEFWLDVSGVVLNVRVRDDGVPESVMVELDRRPGVTYSGGVG